MGDVKSIFVGRKDKGGKGKRDEKKERNRDNLMYLK